MESGNVNNVSENGLELVKASSVQRQFWMLHQISPESPAYNVPSVFNLKGNVDVQRLFTCFRNIIQKNAVFRITFKMIDEQLYQIVHKNSHACLSPDDITSEQKSRNEVARIIKEKINKPFDLENGPLLRINLYQIGIEEYVLVVVMHHTIIDLQGKDVFWKQVSEAYNSLPASDGHVNALSYLEYSANQVELTKSADFEKMLKYWSTALARCPSILELPIDRTRPLIRTFNGKTCKFDIPESTLQYLRLFAEEESVTPFVAFLSAYFIFLYKYTCQNIITVGVPFTNRRHEDIRDTIGCFVNTLPINISISSSETYKDIVTKVRKAMLLAHRAQEVPIEEIVKELNVSGNAAYNPLYQVGFTIEHPADFKLNMVNVTPCFVQNDGSKLDLMMSFMEYMEKYTGFLEYDDSLFEPETINRWTRNYLKTIENLLKNSSVPLGKVQSITESEQDDLIRKWNQTHKDYDLTQTFPDMFRKIVKESPDSTAIDCSGCKLTYRELDVMSSEVAEHLIEIGAGPEKTVVLCVGRSVEMIAGLIGILKSGAAYVPVDPDFPNDRISYILKDSSAIAVLTHSDFEERFRQQNVTLAYVDKITGKRNAVNLPDVSLKSENIAYVIYTSGSTGKPKGVEICHRSLTNFLYSMQENPGLSPQDSILSVTTISFDIAGLEILLPLTVGAKVLLAEKNAAVDGQRMTELIEAYNPTIMQATPSTWNILLDSGWKKATGMTILCGGEAMTKSLADRLLATGGRVWNMYGPTETTIWSSLWEVKQEWTTPPIGEPIANTQLYILSENLQPVPIGVKGELYIGGAGLARGYHNNPSLTKEKFIKNPFVKADSCGNASVMYKTGDLARRMPDGSIQVLGRNDFQVKIHGFRIELGEIESVIEKVDFVNQCAVIVREDFADDKHIVAYVTLRKNHSKENNITEELRKCITSNLPAYMNPSFYVILDDFPKTVSGKIDRKSLPKPDYSESINKNTQNVNYTEEETTVASVWQKTLKVDKIPVDINFFDAGGTSLLAVKLASELQRRFNRKIPVSFIFQYPSIKVMSAVLNKKDNVTVETAVDNKAIRNSVADTDDIAVVGMSCRFPGSENLSEYWKSLCDARDEISFFSDQQMPADVDISIRNNEMYVRAKGVLKSVNQFDPDFFGLTHQVADITDPQIRLFLEHSYDALENAGFSQRQSDVVGVYASMGRSQYLRHNILTRPDIVDKMGELQIELGNEKDYIATRLSHTLNLTGPSVSVSTACSSSLVAIIMACQAIKHGECNMAVAGGSNITFPLYRGYLYQEGAIHSSDGHCRPFDSSASGTVFSDGVGVVVLKKLSQALADKNIIYAIVKGGAINNDGLQKASYTAPGINGQISVIRSAQEAAGVAPETIGYVETHGTATPLGDPVEIDALTQAFRKTTDKKQFCAIGSVKGNIGHTAISAGVAGFIKTALMLYYKKLVPSINFKSANPAINFGESPFFVNTGLKEWPLNGSARRAAVSSFGFGGTNSHLILEEASLQNGGDDRRRWKLLPFSAKTESSLNSYLKRFTEYATANPTVSLSNIAFTLQTGRINYKYRRFFVCSETSNVLADLKQTASADEKPFGCDNNPVKIVFIFPGQGSQYLKMAEDFYKKERTFRSEFDRCASVINRELNVNIADILFSENELNSEKINDVLYSQTALFAVEYALSCLLKSWGIVPDELIGHSVGEFVAASVSGIMSVEDAACLVAIRARLLQSLPQGSMLSVRLTETELLKKLPDDLTIASVNSPVLCVISGNTDSIMNFQKECEKDNIACSMLESSHAFHSSMVNPAVDAFGEAVRKTVLSEPGIPVVSTVTGKYLTKEEATGAEYWTRHMCVTVRFSDAIKTVKGFSENRFFLEVGPKATCTACINQHEWDKTKYRAMPTLPETHEDELDYKEILTAAGELWLRGITIDWNSFYRDEKLIQVSLPSYPFERQTYWVEPGKTAALLSADIDAEDKKSNEIQKTAALPEIEKIESAVPDAAAEIRSIIAQETGVNVSDIEDSETFLQMGLDSLFLTQFSQTIKSKFNITVTLRQLMREHNSVSKLDKFISCSMGG